MAILKKLVRRISGRDIRSITKRVNRMRNDIQDNIQYNDDSITRLADAITVLKNAQLALQSENETGRALYDSISVIK